MVGDLSRSAWLALIFVGIAAIAWRRDNAQTNARTVTRAREPLRSEVTLHTLSDGQKGIVDASGQVVLLRPYQRIAAGSTIADDLLLALAEPERIVMLTRYGREHKRDGHRYGTRPAFQGATGLEALKAQRVDLLILNHLGSPAELSRVRELGIEVFNLGAMRGLSTLLPNIAAVATLLGEPARGAQLARQLVQRMNAVAADIPRAARKRALYVTAYGGQLFGAGASTSYHDVLEAAGLIDVAATKFRDYPHYDPEQLLLMDPDVIATTEASTTLLCTLNGLQTLKACRAGGRGVIGMDDALLGEPGLGMLDAAEALREQVYGLPRLVR